VDSLFSPIDRSAKQKINKETSGFN
jgi:hypothetical protein